MTEKRAENRTDLKRRLPQVLAALWLLAALPSALPSARAQGEAAAKPAAKVEPAPEAPMEASIKTFEFGNGAGAGQEAPRALSVNLDEGNYEVRLRLGDERVACDTTVKAESRRLMLLNARTLPGQFVERTFTVNIRTPRLKSGQSVRLKAREAGSLSWDSAPSRDSLRATLSLEFLGSHPGVRSVQIRRDERAATLFIAGDSTVTDQAEEPWAGWGQMLPCFFKAGLAIANYAESGESLRSFQNERRLQKITDTMRPGDALLIQFGHNDQKEHGEGIGAFTSYKASLKYFVAQAREHGATPILVTSMHRRSFDAAGRITNSLGDYPEAVRQVAREEKAALIDLNSMSRPLYEAWGPEGSKQAFVFYPANTFPGQSAPLKDPTHFNAYGAYELARCIVQGLRTSDTGDSNIKRFLLDEPAPFEPARPDPIGSIAIAPSASHPSQKPEGS